jgi:hypothetical protein
MNTRPKIHAELNNLLLNTVGGTPAFRSAIMLAVQKIRMSGYAAQEAAKLASDRFGWDQPNEVESEAIRFA